LTLNAMRPLILSSPPLIVSGSQAKFDCSDIHSKAESRQCESTVFQTVKSNPTEAADNSRHVSLNRKLFWVVRTKPVVGRGNQSTALWEYPVWS
jgi:hypothetical protein